MKQLRIYILHKNTIVLLLSFYFYSCATILNSKKVQLKVVTNLPSKLVIKNDTSKNISNSFIFSVKRSADPLSITTFNDSISKSINIMPKTSGTFWLNLLQSDFCFIGFIIDTQTKKRYTYPKSIYIDLVKKDDSFSILPDTLTNPQCKNILKVTPLKTLAILNPAYELAYERITSSHFSSQLMLAYLLPDNLLIPKNNYNAGNNGFTIAFEEKFYFQKTAPYGLYSSIEFKYLQNRYKCIWPIIPSETQVFAYSNDTYMDEFIVKKKTYTCNLKLGYQHIYKKFIVDLYSGVGLKYKDVVHFDRLNPKHKMYSGGQSFISYPYNLNGKYFSPVITLNIRFGWLF